ncbi:hypothetical protein N0V90_011241 [Kalmusia sp. IMI 367209]|nr:hypothetical protein N0V90_011241 [Kalmusia sp. IMI 367209]
MARAEVHPGQDRHVWTRNYDPPAPPLPSLFVIASKLESRQANKVLRRDLVIRSPHDIMDGIGTLQLLNNLLKHITQAYEQPATWAPMPLRDETVNLSPALRVAASIPPNLSSQQSQRLENIIEQNANLRSNTELLTTPFKKDTAVTGKHQRTVAKFSEPATTECLRATKALGAIITHVYHAAIVVFLRSLKSREPEPRKVRYVGYGLVHQRSECQGEFSTPKHAALVYHSVSSESLAIDVTGSSTQESWSETRWQEEFESIAKRVKTYYSSIRYDIDAVALAPSFWSMGTPHLAVPASRTI